MTIAYDFCVFLLRIIASSIYLNIYKWAQERGIHTTVFPYLLLGFSSKTQVLYIFGILRPSGLTWQSRFSRFPCQIRIMNGFGRLPLSLFKSRE